MSKSIISHSEADQFLACERRHWYAFGKPIEDENGTLIHGIEPKHYSDGLFRGSLGHEALEIYYAHLAPISLSRAPNEFEFSKARELAIAPIAVAIADNPDRFELILNLQRVLEAYFGYYQDEDSAYQFLAVEVEYHYDVDNDTVFPFKPDLIRRHRKTGRVEVVDHKFLANTYGPMEIAIQPQLAKYVGALRKMGYVVDDAIYNIINHRVLKTKPYDPTISCKRIAMGLTKKRIDQSLLEQITVARNISVLKETPELWEGEVKRHASAFNCKNCSFLAMCVADLNGEDTAVMAKYEFLPNSYGYDKANTPDTLVESNVIQLRK